MNRFYKTEKKLVIMTIQDECSVPEQHLRSNREGKWGIIKATGKCFHILVSW